MVLDEAHLLAATRYVELNPVRASLVEDPGAYRWSSAVPHLTGRDDGVIEQSPVLAQVGDWRRFLSSGLGDEEAEALRRHERTGRPLGSDEFLQHLERLLGRSLRRQKPGPKRKEAR